MKKILLILLILSMLIILASCQNDECCTCESCACGTTDSSSSETIDTLGTTSGTRTEETSSSTATTETTQASDDTETTESSTTIEPVISFVSPADEVKVTKTITAEDERGVKLEITLHGYASESLGKEFYAKHNEYFVIDAKVTNGYEVPIVQNLPTYCRQDLIPTHHHEIDFSMMDENGHKLVRSTNMDPCPQARDSWTLGVGESAEWQLLLVAGDGWNGELREKNGGKVGAIPLYGNDIYVDGSCVFSGAFSFTYTQVNISSETTFTVSADAEVEFVYVQTKK